jgi:hypothetical protein
MEIEKEGREKNVCIKKIWYKCLKSFVIEISTAYCVAISVSNLGYDKMVQSLRHTMNFNYLMLLCFIKITNMNISISK